MNEPAYMVGYSRPPENLRSDKAQSANPGGRERPKGPIKAAFDAALGNALTWDKKALLEWKPTTVIDALVHELLVDALDGRPSAQRLVLSALDDADGGATGEEGTEGQGPRQAQVPRQAGVLRQARVPRQARDEDEDEEEDRFVYDDESTRQRLGDRYGEFKARFERAVNANDVNALAELAEDFDDAKPPWCREKSREV